MRTVHQDFLKTGPEKRDFAAIKIVSHERLSACITPTSRNLNVIIAAIIFELYEFPRFQAIKKLSRRLNGFAIWTINVTLVLLVA